jgi:hypothetical protein
LENLVKKTPNLENLVKEISFLKEFESVSIVFTLKNEKYTLQKWKKCLKSALETKWKYYFFNLASKSDIINI